MKIPISPAMIVGGKESQQYMSRIKCRLWEMSPAIYRLEYRAMRPMRRFVRGMARQFAKDLIKDIEKSAKKEEA